MNVKRLEIENATSALSAIVLSIARVFALCFLLFFVSAGSALALDPNKRMTQYGHTAWRVQDGFFGGAVYSITQTTDGYIWVGTNVGLFRFDGVRFVSWKNLKREPLPSDRIVSLLGASDGSLWIGTSEGLVRWTNPQQFIYLKGEGMITDILETANREIWITRMPTGNHKERLCRIIDTDIRCYDEDDGIPKFGATVPLIQDHSDDFWIGGDTALLKWRPGSSTLYQPEGLKSNQGMGGVNSLAVASDGTLWVGIFAKGGGLGLQRMVGGSLKSFVAPGLNGEAVEALALLEDRDKSMWVGTGDQGIYRIRGDNVDHFQETNGLSGNFVLNFYEDREGSLWVATTKGLDCFRDIRVSSFTTREGLGADAVVSVFAKRDGSVWVGDLGNLDQIGPNGISRRAEKDFQGGQITSILEDRAGRMWVGVENTLRVSQGGEFRQIKRRDGSPIGLVKGIAEDSENNVWALNLSSPRTLMRIRDFEVQEEFSELQIPGASKITADPQNGIWLGLLDGNLARLRSGKTEIFQFPHESSESRINQLITGPDESILGAASFGVVAWRNGRQQLLTVRNGLPCDSIYALIFDNDDALWLYTQCGLVKIAKAELQRWWEEPESYLNLRVFDAADGVQPGVAPFNSSAKSPDGRLWFANFTVLQMVNTARLADNAVVPAVHVEEIIADQQSYSPHEDVKLAPLTRDLRIDYTALSFLAPQKVFFRYKLEGHDADWQEAGTRRQVFYNDLPPGDYRFRVIACNNDGLWNEEGATLNFSIAPAWYQTTAFRLLCFLLVGLIIWGLYRLRIRQVSKVISARFDERLAERTRLARELHDTFIQTIQGSKMVADDALDQSGDPVYMRRAMEQLADWLGQANEEGRAALNSLRTSATETNDLAEAFRRATEACKLQENAEVRFSVVGCAREMHPIVRDEIYRIGYEAIRNACQHSFASQLDVELKYAQDLSVRVKDNGSGIDPVIVSEGREGHFGLTGMRERAKRISAQLTIVSSADSGTEITLVVPEGMVFRKAGETALEP